MQEHQRKQSLARETAILAKVLFSQNDDSDDALVECERLASTAGMHIASDITQRRNSMNVATAFGKGKVEELAALVEQHEADVVIFDNDLSPAQTRNLETAVHVKVIDRTELILDIFATNASSPESRLAVELAQLEYSLPRLKRMWTHLDRVKMGVGMRGPGEKQLEVDRRLVEKRISDLRRELQVIEKRKERLVQSRSDVMTVSLVGYTNAGKSTVMNALTAADVLAEDKLFATLDTCTRRWHLPNWGPILLSDTVGFIKNLPHRLVASFKATLEEARHADLLLHIADGANPAVYDQIQAVYQVLEEIDIEEKDSLLVINKIDQMPTPQLLDVILNRYPHAVAISAVTKEGFDSLSMAVSDALSRSFLELHVQTDVANGKLMAFIAARGEILSKQFSDTEVSIHCRLPVKFAGQIDRTQATVSEVSGDDQRQRQTTEEA
ncbi:MAG TPA: GTPase HflX [Planctomycetaceae bacterium]|nr:GTPase HflX [Planctomycetaceae bacterium]